MTERRPLSPTRPPQSGSSPPPSPLRPTRPILLPRVPRESSPRPGPSQQQQQDPQVTSTGLIAWIESIREDMKRENEAFRENMVRENEIWKTSVQRELREEIRRLVVEKYLADHKPSSSSDTSSLDRYDEPSTSHRPPSATLSGEPSPISPLTPLGHSGPTGGSSPAGPSLSMPPPPTPPNKQLPPLGPSTSRRTQKLPSAGPTPFILPRKPRIGSYYAAIVDTDGDDPDGALLAHMIEIATFRPGFLYSHTGTPEPHRDCCATLYFATIGNVHDWMHDVNNAYRLDNEEIERLEQNSGELKRKRRFDMYVRICKVEAEDPWEIFERRR